MRVARGLALACHPGPVVTVTTLATALAVVAGRGGGAVLVGLAVLTGQLCVGWANDWADAAPDRTSGRTDKPVAAGTISAGLVGGASALAGATCIPLSLASGLVAGLLHLGGVAGGLLYDAGLKRTPLSIACYAAGFATLPSFVTLGSSPSRWAPGWLTAAAVLLGCGAHFTQVLDDIPGDLRQGSRALPQRLGRAGSAVAGTSLLAAALVLVAVAAPGFGAARLVAIVVAGTVIAAVAAAALTQRWRLCFRLTLLLAAAVGAVMLSGGGASLS